MKEIRDYINEKNVINDEIYNEFKYSVTCQICSNIIYEPMICMSCQKVYCKLCISQWALNNRKCPYRCINTNYQIGKDMNQLLSKLKFKCKYCNKILEYNIINNHYLSSCNTLKNNNKDELKNNEEPIIKGIFRKITSKENQIIDIKNKIKSKKYFIFLFI